MPPISRLLFAACVLATPGVAQETIPPPRETEVLTVVPRDVTGRKLPDDPPWIIRGAVRNLGTYDNPYSYRPAEVTGRQVQLLQSLNRLQLFEPEDDLDKTWDQDRPKVLGPEPIPVKPRVVQK